MAVDPTYGPKVYRKQGGDEIVVASSGLVTVQSGGSIVLESGAILDLGASQGTLVGGTDLLPFRRKVALAAVDTAGGLFAVANPEGVAIILTGLWLNVTTVTSGACTADCGIAANGTTLNDTMIDGVSLATTAGVRNHIKNAGTNGLGALPWGASEFLTGSVASGASLALVGFAFYEYVIA